MKYLKKYVRLEDLPFLDGKYKAHFFHPRSGFVSSWEVGIRDGYYN